MMGEKSFPVELVTPEGQLFGGFSDFVAIPAHDGEMGFAYLRSPVMSSLGDGEMRVHIADTERIERFVIQGGFAGTDGDKLVVLASRAQRLDAYDIESVKQRRTDLEDQIAEAVEDDPELPFLRDELSWVLLVHKLVGRANL
ncbi:MAG: F0F1 ATP synthase subunit epsilon [Coriobacteriia bacterium]|nr:F0F1 ATP synthase subunit epsilon [Coriobacteriia bacterium]